MLLLGVDVPITAILLLLLLPIHRERELSTIPVYLLVMPELLRLTRLSLSCLATANICAIGTTARAGPMHARYELVLG